VKRLPLDAGAKSRERGSTFATQPTPLKRSTARPRRRPISEASPEQRAKTAGAVSIISATGPCDPAHLWPRGLGGCDSADCVVPLTREEHRAFDDGRLDLLPHLIAQGCWVELAHAVLAHQVDPIALVHRTTGERYVPERNAA
jgi:hypothetical protein